jgi:hypothetical protein
VFSWVGFVRSLIFGSASMSRSLASVFDFSVSEVVCAEGLRGVEKLEVRRGAGGESQVFGLSFWTRSEERKVSGEVVVGVRCRGDLWAGRPRSLRWEW